MVLTTGPVQNVSTLTSHATITAVGAKQVDLNGRVLNASIPTKHDIDIVPNVRQIGQVLNQRRKVSPMAGPVQSATSPIVPFTSIAVNAKHFDPETVLSPTGSAQNAMLRVLDREASASNVTRRDQKMHRVRRSGYVQSANIQIFLIISIATAARCLGLKIVCRIGLKGLTQSRLTGSAQTATPRFMDPKGGASDAKQKDQQTQNFARQVPKPVQRTGSVPLVLETKCASDPGVLASSVAPRGLLMLSLPVM